METRKYYSTVVLSDIHLGSEYSHTEEVTAFLRHIECERLILNGDIIDGWQLRKPNRHWERKHTDFFKVLMKMMEKQGTEIIYVRGNHDDFLDNLAPLHFSNLSVVKEYTFTSHGKTYYVTHGDIFDTVTTHMRWLARLGDTGYTCLLAFNRLYNYIRRKQGKPYYSLSQQVKHCVKSAVSYISDFEKELVRLAESKKADGIICGHIHQAADVRYGHIRYLNSGDWVESLTALTENEQGEWNIVIYNADDYRVPEENEPVRTEPLYAAVI